MQCNYKNEKCRYYLCVCNLPVFVALILFRLITAVGRFMGKQSIVLEAFRRSIYVRILKKLMRIGRPWVYYCITRALVLSFLLFYLALFLIYNAHK